MDKQSKENVKKGMKRIIPTLAIIACAILLLFFTTGCETHKESSNHKIVVKKGEWNCDRLVQSLEEAMQHNCMSYFNTVKPIY